MFLLKHIDRIVDLRHLLLLIVDDADLHHLGKPVIVTYRSRDFGSQISDLEVKLIFLSAVLGFKLLIFCISIGQRLNVGVVLKKELIVLLG